MTLPLVNLIVLSCLEKMNGERSIYAIYHLLKGKKSAQTIQDLHLFRLSSYFKIYRRLSRAELEQILAELERDEHVVKHTEHCYRLTELGMDVLRAEIDRYPFFKFINGWKYQSADLFWRRLTLLVQVASNLNMCESIYMPIQRDKDTQHWVKVFLQKTQKIILHETLYGELCRCLFKIREVDPSVLVIRLTGHRRIGLSDKQACEDLNLDFNLYHFQFISCLHQMMNEVQVHPDTYPLLGAVIENLYDDRPLTESTKRTLQMLRRNYSAEEVARMRNLKLSTIHDHIVEIALQVNEFDIRSFISLEKQISIIEAARICTSKQLKSIRMLVPDASYFEIRLCLARLGDEDD